MIDNQSLKQEGTLFFAAVGFMVGMTILMAVISLGVMVYGYVTFVAR